MNKPTIPGEIKVRIRKGAIQVAYDCCRVKVRHDDCVIIEIRCLSKYPLVHSLGDDGKHPILLLETNEYSLSIDEKRRGKLTKITFTELPCRQWYIHSATEGGRYKINITFLREDRK
jgi:hypothetical protein